VALSLRKVSCPARVAKQIETNIFDFGNVSYVSGIFTRVSLKNNKIRQKVVSFLHLHSVRAFMAWHFLWQKGTIFAE
jgi:hypothetical protein